MRVGRAGGLDRWIACSGGAAPGTLAWIMRRIALRFSFLTLLAAACGSRTGLFTDPNEFGPSSIDGGTTDGSIRDGGRDRREPPEEDALPPIDARPPVDVVRNDCPDADATLIYVISVDYELYSFYPPDGTFKLIGNIACPSDPGATPFSMAVDRKGTAFILFNDERLYRVSTLNAACVSTPYVPRQSNFGTFGMGFATNDIGPTEALYVSGDRNGNAASDLARIDMTTFKLTVVGDPGVERAELTGTGDGRLFAFYTKNLNSNGPPSYIGEINTQTAQVIAEKRFDTVDQGNAWAFAFWGGDFYMFHAPSQASSTVTRWRPSDDSVVQVATLPTRIVGAGVSTCAPQQ